MCNPHWENERVAYNIPGMSAVGLDTLKACYFPRESTIVLSSPILHLASFSLPPHPPNTSNLSPHETQ